jgi:protein-disulfide isomerase
LEQLQKDYGNDLKIVYKQLVVHPDTATIPALAVCAAQKQNKFEAMEKRIWEKGWSDSGPDNLGREAMEGFAKQLKLDMAKFKADLDSEGCKQQLADNKAMLQRLGVRGTPGFFVNGRYLVGAQPIAKFKGLIDEEIKKADDALKNGAKLQDYYASIVASGKKSIGPQLTAGAAGQGP